MKIGIWSDTVGFPSLPLMKLSAYHKSLGDTVEFIQEGGHYDKAYLSKVFNLPTVRKIPTSPPPFYADEVERGGSGYAIDIVDGIEVFRKERHFDLPAEIEHLYPDYSLYPKYQDIAYGFLTRGCCNACGFCIVSEKEGRCSLKVADLTEFRRDQKTIKLLDPNILACRERDDLLRQLVESKARVDFTQGLDARFITEDVVAVLNVMKVRNIHFAFDFMKNEQAILKGLACFNDNYKKSRWNLNCYILTNYDTTPEEDWYRVRKVQELGFHPDVRVYQKGTQSQFLTDLQHWSNNRIIFNSTSFEDFVPRVDGKSCKELYPEILNKKEIFVMAKKAENPEVTTAEITVDFTTLNVYQKLQMARAKFLSSGVKKTGKNIHLEFTYFELVDIVPVAERIFSEVGLLGVPRFESEIAYMDIIDIDHPEQFAPITFYAPFSQIEPIVSNSGKEVTNKMQALGSSITYMRRYLWQLALDIIETDDIDPNIGAGSDAPAPAAPKTNKTTKPATPAQRNEIKKEVTSSDAPADELQIKALKAALKQLMELDAEQESFVQEIAVKTEGFTNITKEVCEALVNGVAEMIAGYTAQEG